MAFVDRRDVVQVDPYLAPAAIPARVREQLARTLLVQCHAPEGERPRTTGEQCLACPHFRGLVRVDTTMSGDATKDYRGRCDAPRGRELMPVAGDVFVRCPEASAKVTGAVRYDAISTAYCGPCPHSRGLLHSSRLAALFGRASPPRMRCAAPKGVQYVPLFR